jgi:hypothetical protein
MNSDLLKRTFVRLDELRNNRTDVAIAERKAHHNTIIEAAKPEHSHTFESITHDDKLVCACGWESAGYWDGRGFAFDDWLKHLRGLLE